MTEEFKGIKEDGPMEEKNMAITIRRATDQYSYIETTFTGAIDEAMFFHDRLAEKYLAEQQIARKMEDQGTGAGSSSPSCECGEYPDKKTSKSGNIYYACPKCKKWSKDGVNWMVSTPYKK